MSPNYKIIPRRSPNSSLTLILSAEKARARTSQLLIIIPGIDYFGANF
ncbi:MAG: hypothetical protein N4A36_04315 [Candidatus Gracilibacteria bacterium]|nr:hypothetical protein [Candidatus Gracilibacteria bacterium]